MYASMTDDAPMSKTPSSKRLNDPEYWRSLAKEARTVAERMIAGDARESMLRVATLYEEIAKKAVQRWLAKRSK
jgi:hypothetical protein